MSKHPMGRPLGWAFLALTVTAGAFAPLAGQGVTYVTISKPEMAGAMGMMARMAPGAMSETRVTTAMQGTFMRTDEADETSTIMDMAAGRYTFLNHRDRTWYTLTLDEMMAGATTGVVAATPAEEGSMPDIQVERTGKTQRFDGYTAEQFVMSIDPPPGEEGPTPEEAGSMAILVEIWSSRDFPGHDAFMEAQKAMAGGAGAGMAKAFATDPAMAEAVQRIAEQMKEMEGVPVRTVTSMVMVPPGATLDREAILADSDKPLASAGGAGGIGDAARQALGGILGRRRQQPPPEEAEAPTGPSVFMRITQVVEDIRVGPIPEDRFQVPAGYQEAAPVR